MYIIICVTLFYPGTARREQFSLVNISGKHRNNIDLYNIYFVKWKVHPFNSKMAIRTCMHSFQ